MHSSADGHLGCFQVLAVVNNAFVSFQIMFFSRFMPRSRIVGDPTYSWNCLLEVAGRWGGYTLYDCNDRTSQKRQNHRGCTKINGGLGARWGSGMKYRGFFRAVKILCMLLFWCLKSSPVCPKPLDVQYWEWALRRWSLGDCGGWHGFIPVKTGTILSGDIDNGGGVCGKSLLLPLDFIVDLKFPFASFAPWKKSYHQPRQHIKKQRHYFTNKGLFQQSCMDVRVAP